MARLLEGCARSRAFAVPLDGLPTGLLLVGGSVCLAAARPRRAYSQREGFQPGASNSQEARFFQKVELSNFQYVQNEAETLRVAGR
jgi:hypothetical protein